MSGQFAIPTFPDNSTFLVPCYHPTPMRRLAAPLSLFSVPITANAWTRASTLVYRTARPRTGAARSESSCSSASSRSLAAASSALENDDGSESHHYFVLCQGKLRERMEQEPAARSPRSAATSRWRCAEHPGMVARSVADANNSFHTSDADPRLSVLCTTTPGAVLRRRMAHFPTVFYALSANFQLGNHLDRTVVRSFRLSALMSEEYFRGGAAHQSPRIRRPLHGLRRGSVCHSHAVTGLVNLYYHI